VKTRSREAQQEPEGVAVRSETVDEEALEERLKSHGRISSRDF
jgi:hypothetical protein